MNLLGGQSGKDSPQGINVPPFLSSGGITPEQQTLAEFTKGQDLTGQATAFGGEGLGDSTMATQGAEGAANTEAQAIGGMSDTDQSAMYTDYQNQVQAEEQNLQNQITLGNQNSSSLSSLAGAAGNLFGSGTASSLGGELTGAAGAGVGADTPALTDATFSGLSDAAVLAL
jgi:hypothetical protein